MTAPMALVNSAERDLPKSPRQPSSLTYSVPVFSRKSTLTVLYSYDSPYLALKSKSRFFLKIV